MSLLIAFGIAVPMFVVVIGGTLLAQGPIMDFRRWRQSRKRRTRIEKTRTLPGRPSRAIGRA